MQASLRIPSRLSSPSLHACLYAGESVASIVSKTSEHARNLLNVSRGGLFLFDHRSGELVTYSESSSGEIRQTRLPAPVSGLIAELMVDGESVNVATDRETSLHRLDKQDVSVLYVPVTSIGSKACVGILQLVNDTGTEAFGKEVEQVLEELAYFVGVALYSAQAYERQSVLQTCYADISVQEDAENVVAQTVSWTLRLTFCKHASLFLVDGSDLVCRYARGPSRKGAKDKDTFRCCRVSTETFPLSEVLRTSKCIHIKKLSKDKRYSPSELKQLFGDVVAEEILAAPVLSPDGSGRVIGVLLAANKRAGPPPHSKDVGGGGGTLIGMGPLEQPPSTVFDAQDALVLQGMGKILGGLLAGCERHRETQIQGKIASCFVSELSTMNKLPSMSTAVESCRKHAVEIVQADWAAVYVIDPSGKELWATVISDNNESTEIRHHIEKGDMMSFVQVSAKLVNYNAASDQDRRLLVKAPLGMDVLSMLCVPIWGYRSKKVIGVIQVVNKRKDVSEFRPDGPLSIRHNPAGFSAADEQNLTLLAAVSSVAIENSKQFKQSRFQGQILAGPLEQFLLHTKSMTHEHSVEVLGQMAKSCAISITDAQFSEFFWIDNVNEKLCVQVNDISVTTLEERGAGLLPDHAQHQWVKLPITGIAGAVIKSGTAISIGDAAADIRFKPAVDYYGFDVPSTTLAWVAVPVVDFDGELLGILQVGVSGKEGAPLGRDHLLLMESLASRLGLAMSGRSLISKHFALNNFVEALSNDFKDTDAFSAAIHSAAQAINVEKAVVYTKDTMGPELLMNDSCLLRLQSSTSSFMDQPLQLPSIEMGMGVAGFVAEAGTGVVIHDISRMTDNVRKALESDPRRRTAQHSSVSSSANLYTEDALRSVLCVPALDGVGQVAVVVEGLNKRKSDLAPESFSDTDSKILKVLGQSLGTFSRNCCMIKSLLLLRERNRRFASLCMELFLPASPKDLITTIISTARELLSGSEALLFLVDQNNPTMMFRFSDGKHKTYAHKVGMAAHVLNTGELLNIDDPSTPVPGPKPTAHDESAQNVQKKQETESKQHQRKKKSSSENAMQRRNSLDFYTAPSKHSPAPVVVEESHEDDKPQPSATSTENLFGEGWAGVLCCPIFGNNGTLVMGAVQVTHKSVDSKYGELKLKDVVFNETDEDFLTNYCTLLSALVPSLPLLNDL